MAQSFTVSCDGNITDVSFDIGTISGDDNAITNATISIRSGNDPTGTIVGSSLTGVTLTASSVNNFDFSSAGVNVTNGNQYTLVIFDEGDADDFQALVNSTSVYAGGTFWSDAATEVTANDAEFSVTVNDIPVITVPGTQSTDGVTNVTFTAGTLISIADGDTDNQSVTIDVVNNGIFSTSTGTLTVTASGAAVVGGSGTASVTISGTLADVNGTLDGMQYVPGSVAGQHQITVGTNDGNGGADSETVLVNVSGTYTLANTNDSGVGSLRAAIIDANTVSSAADIIDATGQTGTITVLSNFPQILDHLTINGPGASQLAVDGQSSFYAIQTSGTANLAINDITIQNCSNANDGGGIRYNSTGTLTLSGVHLDGNTATGANSGGGVFINANGSADITQSLFTTNSSGTNSGGAIQSVSTGTINISNTTFNGNSTGNGGAISHVASGTVNLDHVTIIGNTGSTSADGIYLSSGTITLNYSIVYSNGTEDVNNFSGTFDAEGLESIIGASTGTISNAGSVTDGSTDFSFSALANNGGETQTMSISGSEALATASGSTETNDQTGNGTRNGTGFNDLGAYEAPPQIVGAHFFDTGTPDGNIDEIVIELSEEVDEGSADEANFTISTGTLGTPVNAAGASNSLDATDNDQYVTIPVSSYTGTSVGGESLSYTPGTLTNAEGTAVATNASITLIDVAAPVIIGAVTDDNNGNGQIDRLEITLSENIVDGSSTLDGGTIAVGGFTGETTSTGDTGNDNLLRVTLPESGTPDTDDTPSVSLTAGDVVDAANNSIGSNQNFGNATDGADPVIVEDVTLDSDLDGDIDAIELRISEPITDLDVTAGDFTLSTDAGVSNDAFDGFNTAVTVLKNDNGADDDYFTLTLSSPTDVSGTAVGQYNYTTSTAIDDSEGNQLQNFGFTAAVDGAAPVIISALTDDNNGNGQVDRIDVTLSEIIDDGSSTLDGGTIPVGGFTGETTNSGDTPNDNLLRVVLPESGTPDTDVTPSVTLNAGDVVDGVPNSIGSDQSFGNATDGADPVIVEDVTLDANLDGNLDAIELRLSEPITDLDVTAGDFSLSTDAGVSNDLFDGFNTAVTVLASDPDGNDDYFTLTISSPSNVTGTAVGQYDYTTSTAIDDAEGNQLGNFGFTAAVDGAAPVVVAATTDDNDGNGQIDRVDITMSENIDDGSSTLDGGTFDIGTFAETTNTGDTPNDNLLRAVLTESGSGDTDGTPTVTLTAGDVVDGVPNTIGTNQSFGVSTDGADPVIIEDITLDTDLDGDLDAIELRLSEPITDLDVTAGDFSLSTDAGVSNDLFDGFNTAVTVLASDPDGNDDYFTLTISSPSNVTGTAVGQYNYTTSTAIDDAEGNQLGNFGFTAAVDGAAPVIIGAVTDDNDGNGQIDRIDLTMSESIDDGGSTFDGSTVTVGAFTTVTSTGDTGNDNLLRVALTENGSSTDATPAVTLNATTVFDGIPNSIGSNQAFGNASDGADPVVISAYSLDNPTGSPDGNVESIELEFSENIVDVEISGGTLADWDISDGSGSDNIGGFNTQTEVVSGGTDGDANDEFVTLTFTPSNATGTGAFTLDYNNSGSNITDGNSNILQNFSGLALTDGAKPVVFSTASDLTPNDNEGAASPTSTLSMVYSEDIAGVGGGILTLVEDEVPPDIFNYDVTNVSEVSITGNNVTVNLGFTMKNLTDYYVLLSDGAFDDSPVNAGNTQTSFDQFNDNADWNWTTATDLTPPTLVGSPFTPANGATNISPLTTLSVEFDEVVQVISGSGNNYTITEDGVGVFETSAIEGANVSGNGTTTITITPLTELVEGTIYYISIPANSIEDAAGNDYASAIGGNNVWEFQIVSGSPNALLTNGDMIPRDELDDPVDIDPTPISTLKLKFDENVIVNTGTIGLYEFTTDDLIEQFDVTNIAEVEVGKGGDPNDLVSIELSNDLSGSTHYYVIVPAGAFRDAQDLPFGGLIKGDWDFTTEADTENPFIVSTSPADNDGSVSITGTSLTATFNEPVTVGTGNIELRLLTTNEVVASLDVTGGNVSITGKTLTANFTSSLANNQFSGSTGYFINIDPTGIDDASGNSYAGISNNTSWNFTTESGTDLIAPSISTLSPINTGTDISVTEALVVTFDEPVVAVGGLNVELYVSPSSLIETIPATNTSINGGEVTISLATLDSLLYGTTYHLRFDGGAFEDAEGNGITAVTNNSVWEFSTIADGFPPKLETLTPADDASGVGTQPTLTLEFVETIQDQLAGGTIDILYNDGVLVQAIPMTDGGVSFGTPRELNVNLATVGLTLSGSTEYYVRLNSNAIEDAAGNPFAGISGDGTWSFTTTADVVDPSLSSNTENQLDPTLDIILSLTFDERVTPISGGDLFIEYADGQNTEIYRVELTSATPDNVTTPPGSIFSYTIPAGTLRGGITYTVGIDGDAGTGTNGFQDASGRVYDGFDADDVTWTFTTSDDGAPPIIVNLTPPDGEVGTGLTQNLVIEFDQPVVANGTGGIELRYSSSDELIQSFVPNSVTGTLSNTTYTYNPTADFEGNTDFYVLILAASFTDNVNDNTDLSATTQGEWTFQSTGGGNPPDATLNPADVSGSFDIRGNLILNFNEPVFTYDENITISGGPEGNIIINGLGSQVSGDGSTTITINPDNDLHGGSAGETYSVNISTGGLNGTLQDASGNIYDLQADPDVGADNTWTFTTTPTLYPDDGTGNTPTMIACYDEEFISQQDPIILQESSPDDFRSTGGLFTMIFEISGGFEFNTGVTPTIANDNASGDFTLLTTSFTNATTLQINLTADATANQLDAIRITGLEFKNTPPNEFATGTLTRTGGTMDAYGLSVSHQISILDLSSERIDIPDIAVGAPPAGDVELANVTFCISSDYTDPGQDNYDVSYGLNNSYTDVQVNVNFDGANYEYGIYRDQSLTDNVKNEVGVGAGQVILNFDDFFDATDYASLASSGTQTRWVTYINPNGCESEPVQIDFTVYGLPDADGLAGQDYDVAELGNVCSFEEITLGDPGNPGLTNYTFTWAGNQISGGLITSSNPTFNVRANSGDVGPETEMYTLDVSDNNGCQDPNQGMVDVVIDRRVDVQMNSPSGLAFVETNTTGQTIEGDRVIIGDFGDDNLLGYTGDFIGTGVGSEVLTDINLHTATFTPSAAGQGSFNVYYLLTEDLTGCTDSASLLYTVSEDVSAIFTNVVPSQVCLTGEDLDPDINDITMDARTDNLASGFFKRFNAPGVVEPPGYVFPTNILTDGWVLDLSVAFAAPDGPLVTTLPSGAKEIEVERITDNSGIEATDGSFTITIYPLPNASFDITTTYYCEDSPDELITYSLENAGFTNNNVAATSYIIDVIGPVGISNEFALPKSSTAIGGGLGGTLDFSAILADPDIGLDGDDALNFRDEIQYEITIITQSGDDPLPTSLGCPIEITRTITVFAKPENPALVLGAGRKAGTTLSPNVYGYEYVEGPTTLPGNLNDIETLVVTPDNPLLSTSITWYLDNGAGGLGATIAPPADPRNVLDVDLFSTTSPAAASYIFHFTQTSNDGVFAGCESDFSTVNFDIYAIPNEPALDLLGTTGELVSNKYVFEYCEGISVDDVIIDVIDPVVDDVDFYDWYNSTGTLIDGFDSTSMTPGTTFDDAGVGTVGAAGNVSATAVELLGTNTPTPGTYTFYISRRDDRNSTALVPAASLPGFAGARSDVTQIDIVVYGVPAGPVAGGLFDTDIYAASGELDLNTRITTVDPMVFPETDELYTVFTPGETNIEYRWYANTTDGITGGTLVDGNDDATEIDFGTLPNFTTTFGTIGNYYQTNTTTTYTAYLSQITNNLDKITNNGFIGCETVPGGRTPVNVTIYPVDDKPVVDGFDTGSDNIGDDVEYDFCEDVLIGTTDFTAATTFVEAGTDQYFKWYVSDASGARIEEITTGTLTDQNATIDASELQIAGLINDATRYFLVSQVTDINDPAGFEGVESEGTLLRINIYDLPNRPDEQTSTLDFYYCDQDGIGDINVVSTDADPVVFYWYQTEADALSKDPAKRLSTGAGDGSAITALELIPDELNDAGQTVTNLGVDPDPGTYTFYVTQTSNIKTAPSTDDGNTYESANFDGCESDPLEITVWVRDIPVAPAVFDQTLLICEDESTPSFTISGFDSKITYNWSDSLDNPQALGQSFTPTNFSTTGFFGYRVTQTTDINLNNDGFVGCQSPVTPLLLTVREIPGALSTSGIFDSDLNSDIYEICEGDTIPTFEIDNPDLVSQGIGTTEYLWYDESQDAINASSVEVFNPENDINQNLVSPETERDFVFFVSQRTNINISEDFNGCISELSEVRLRINGLPELSFTDVVSDDAFCLEEGTIDFSAGPLGIDGTGQFSLFNDFSSVGTGLTDNGDGTASLDLSDLHLTDDDPLNPVAAADKLTIGGSSTIRNIYFEYTDIEGCVNTDSLTNVVVNPFPAIDFRIDDQLTDLYETCINDAINIEEFRDFFLVGVSTETGASLGKVGISDFVAFDDNGNELLPGIGILSDVDAVAVFSPKDARKSLSNTGDPLVDDPVQLYSPANTYLIQFTHTDNNGCTSVVDNSIEIRPLPEFVVNVDGFIITNKACATETVEFDVNLNNQLESDATFTWKIVNDIIDGQVTNSINVLADDFNLFDGGARRVTVTAENNFTGCRSEIFEEKTIGVNPNPRMRWDNITSGNFTVFNFEEEDLQLGPKELREFTFRVYDQNDNIVRQTDRNYSQISAANPDSTIVAIGPDSLSFTQAGIYRATLFMESVANCDTLIERNFNVLDVITLDTDGILHTFDNGNEGWHTDSISVSGFYDGIDIEELTINQKAINGLRYSTWERAVPSGASLNLNRVETSQSITGAAWITNANGPYGSKGQDNSEAENSWVYSPSYDVSALSKPAISFYYSSHLLNTDGVVVQYSIDDGATWAALGEFSFDQGTSGISWYNFLGLPGNPGNIDDPSNTLFNPDQYGWTNETNIPQDSDLATEVDSSYYWHYAAHKIDEIDENGNFIIPQGEWGNIRFRIALGSRPSEKKTPTGRNLEGFAFDNFRIFDRQKVVLLESFSSALDQNSIDAEGIIGDRVAQAGVGTVWINYFTDLDGEIDRLDDELFARNENDPSARSGFYGVAEIPTSVLDGEVVLKPEDPDTQADALLGWNPFALNRKELSEPQFDIQVISNPTNTDDEVSVTGIFTSRINLEENSEISFRFVILENYIVNQEFGNYTVQDTIRNVMRKVLPDASGYVEKGSVTVGDIFSFNVDWTVNAIYNLDQLRIVAFVQNEITKDVYQVGFVDLGGKSNTVTGLGDALKGEKYVLYPNPADETLSISLGRSITVDLEWTLFDQLGRVMKEGRIPKNQKDLTIKTSDVSSGVYFLQLHHERFKWEPRKVIILHD